MHAGMPVKHLNQGGGPSGYPVDSWDHGRLDCGCGVEHCPGARTVHGLDEVTWYFSCSQYLLRQLDAKGTFEAEQELHSSQAIKAKIAFQRTVEGDEQGVVFMGVELDREL